MSEPPLVAILTVTTNAAGHLPAYLATLRQVTYPRWRLWLVDNGSSDGSAALARAGAPGAVVLENGMNRGFTGACNRALREMLELPPPERPAYVLFLNDDTEVTPGFLERLVARADERTLVAPRTYLAGTDGLMDDATGSFDWWRGRWRERSLGRRERLEERRLHAVESANLSCLFVPLELFERVGLLDDAFFVYYDDTDLCRRARAARYRILVEPAAVVYHRKGATLGGQGSAFGAYYLARNRPYLVRKHEGRTAFAAFLAYYLGSRAVRCAAWAARGRRDLAGATVAGLRDFLLGRMGPGRPPGRGP